MGSSPPSLGKSAQRAGKQNCDTNLQGFASTAAWSRTLPRSGQQFHKGRFKGGTDAWHDYTGAPGNLHLQPRSRDVANLPLLDQQPKVNSPNPTLNFEKSTYPSTCHTPP